MAYDKIIDSSVLNAGLTEIASAIREKTGSSGLYSFPSGFIDAVTSISNGVEGIAADAIITLNTNIYYEFTTIYNIPGLNNLDWYLIYLYYIGDDTTSKLTTEMFLCTDWADNLVIYRYTNGTFSHNTDDSLTVDEDGNIKVKPYSGNYPLSGTYRLLVFT